MTKLAQLVAILGTSLLAIDSQKLLTLYQEKKKKRKQKYIRWYNGTNTQATLPVRAGSAKFNMPTGLQEY